ncbi:MAG: bacteriohemerythrin [Alphaproteobacteria bacterium]|nr:bacteriohemerythrin [Alphaproteobacteria bacterium]
MIGIIHIEITQGVYWVEVPQADLRLLCGCPADVVKHMMRRGLIRPTEIGGVRCETGPNAILLSDVMVQNGAFSNLAEFPVLQMFYRQGMLLPNHPGNTGMRPVLVGGRDQVQAQMQYIYRGNYGLISREELIEAGVTPHDAEWMMRLKLRFAFGRIQHPSALIEGLALDDDPVEIRGVTLRRTGVNMFEISHDGETVSVDLNLPPGTEYECPFPLGAFQFRRDYFVVVHSGEGDGWDIRRPSMGSVLVFQGRIYLIDAGPNLGHTLGALGIGINEVEGVFQTHAHDDHFAGLTTLMQADRKIKFLAVPMVRATVAKKLSALLSIEESDFEDFFDVADLEMGAWNGVGGLDVKPIFSPHPVETTIFEFRAMAADGYRTYAHFADIVGLGILKGMVIDDSDKPGLSQAMFDEVGKAYLAPADVKKVDIGGGLIHGNAADFATDISRKIILAHTAQPLTTEQRRIGSGASFGSADVLIASHRDFLGRAAYHFLHDYFPGVDGDDLGALLNGPVRTFNPETILQKVREIPDNIHLLLTGQVEVLAEETDFRAVLSAGALLGEMTGLHGLPSVETVRAMSFVQVLEIPCELYATFVRRHELFGTISALMERREFLSRQPLLAAVVSTSTLNAIAGNMTVREHPEGALLDARERMIGLIESGKVSRMVGTSVIEELGPGDFFGEDYAVFDIPGIATLKATAPSRVHMVPARLLGSIPNVRWKLFESFQRRSSLVAAISAEDRTVLAWRPEYSVNIQRIDTQHKRLFATANALLDSIERGQGRAEVFQYLEFLLNYTQYHFQEEEELLAHYGYVHHGEHQGRHKALIDQVQDMADRVMGAGGVDAQELLEFLHGWIVNHILVEDRKYAVFLNEKGVF